MKKQRGKSFLKGVLLLVIVFILVILTKWYYGIGLLFLVLLYKAIKVKKRGYLMKDKTGNELKTKQFFKRWKRGIEGITPLQQAYNNILGTLITLSGILGGIVINVLVRMKNQWIWIEVILIGSLILIVISLINSFQKYWRFKEIDKITKELEND